MFLNLQPEFLYASYRLTVEFADDLGTSKEVQGTGFMLGLKDNTPALVTNRHLLDLSFGRSDKKFELYSPKKINVFGRTREDKLYRFEIDLLVENSGTFLRFSNIVTEDVAILFRPHIRDINNLPNKKIYFHFGKDDLADVEFFKKDLEILDMLAFSGFPHEHDRLSTRPIMRSGRVASDPRHDYSLDGKVASRCLVYETYSSSGASGSPVFALPKISVGLSTRDFKLVGVNAGHLTELGENHHVGLSYFFKSTSILDVLRSAGEI